MQSVFVYRRNATLVLCALFAAFAVVVAAGVFGDIDQWAVDHAMPGARFRNGSESFLHALIPLYATRWSAGWSLAVNVVTLPASFLVALAIVTACSRRLGVALVAGVAVELVCKETLDKPALYAGSFHIVPFDSSFPSGHTLRTVLVAIAVAHVRPQLRIPAALWAAASIALLLLAGWHTPSDILGGVLLGFLCARAAGALGRRRLARG
jgi:membrane-associated phospholipid phosphatase